MDDHVAASGPRTRVRAVGIAIGVAGAVAAVVSVSDRGPSRNEPLAECADYAASIQRCFGAQRTIALPPPPRTDAEREVARKRCVEDRLRVESACR